MSEDRFAPRDRSVAAAATDMAKRQANAVIRRRAEIHAPAAIYGTIVVAVILVVLRVEEVPGPARSVIAAMVSSTVVLFLAHVYSKFVGERVQEGRRLSTRERADILSREWPMLTPLVFPCALFIASWLHVVPLGFAFTVSIGYCVGSLFVWGVLYARVEGWTWQRSAVTGVVNALCGFLIIALEAWLH